MRNPTLRKNLREFVEQASLQLADDAGRGDGVPFEVIESSTRGPALYCYRPLTGKFIEDSALALGRLPSYTPAVQSLRAATDLGDYLRFHAVNPSGTDQRLLAQKALVVFLGSVFTESSDFELSDQRFDRAYLELERIVYEGRTLARALIPIYGITTDTPDIDFGDGLSLIHEGVIEDLPADAVWTHLNGSEPTLFAVLTINMKGKETQNPAATAHLRFRRLATALRLFQSEPIQVGPIGWVRVDEGAWRAHTLGVEARLGPVLSTIGIAHEDEFRAFLNLVSTKAPRGGEIAWALRRYEFGCERLVPFESLSDYILGLRSLLEPEGPESGRLAGRVAAVCALPEDRGRIAERVEQALLLERAAIAGSVAPGSRAEALIDDIGGYLRALLRDAICGHLDSDVCAVADELLRQGAEPVEYV